MHQLKCRKMTNIEASFYSMIDWRFFKIDILITIVRNLKSIA